MSSVYFCVNMSQICGAHQTLFTFFLLSWTLYFRIIFYGPQQLWAGLWVPLLSFSLAYKAVIILHCGSLANARHFSTRSYNSIFMNANANMMSPHNLHSMFRFARKSQYRRRFLADNQNMSCNHYRPYANSFFFFLFQYHLETAYLLFLFWSIIKMIVFLCSIFRPFRHTNEGSVHAYDLSRWYTPAVMCIIHNNCACMRHSAQHPFAHHHHQLLICMNIRYVWPAAIYIQ